MRRPRAWVLGTTLLAALGAADACADDAAVIDADDGVGGFDPSAGSTGGSGATTTSGGAGASAAGGASSGGAGGGASSTSAGGAGGANGGAGGVGGGGATGGQGGAPVACAPGTANCDGEAANGCEVSIASDPSHCGACAIVCKTVHGDASCTAGACSSACGVKAGVVVATGGRSVDSDDPTEAAIDAPAGSVITGVGLRVNSDDVVTLRARVQPVVGKGELGAPKEVRAGSDAQGKLEVNVDLPPCFVLVGVGARSNSDDAKTFHVWGAPLLASGKLGAAQLFTDGSEPKEKVEVEVVAPAGRALTGVGFRVKDDDFLGLRAVTDAWTAK